MNHLVPVCAVDPEALEDVEYDLKRYRQRYFDKSKYPQRYLREGRVDETM